MANQEEMVIGYPVETFFNHQAQPTFPTALRPTTTSTATTNSTAIYTPRTPPYTTQNRPTTTNNNNNIKWSTIEVYIISTISALLTFGSILFVIIYGGHINHFHTTKFQVDSLTIYPFNISSSHITANWNFNFSITNPTQNYVFYYDDISASVFYGKKNISSITKLGSFLQNSGDKRMVQATFVASSAYVNNSVARAILADLSHGAVNFTVIVNATTTIDPGTRHEKMKKMIVSCEDVKVGFSLNTTASTMLGGSREVSLNKINM